MVSLSNRNCSWNNTIIWSKTGVSLSLSLLWLHKSFAFLLENNYKQFFCVYGTICFVENVQNGILNFCSQSLTFDFKHCKKKNGVWKPFYHSYLGVLNVICRVAVVAVRVVDLYSGVFQKTNQTVVSLWEYSHDRGNLFDYLRDRWYNKRYNMTKRPLIRKI